LKKGKQRNGKMLYLTSCSYHH